MQYPPEFVELVKRGVGRAVENVTNEIPLSAVYVTDWLKSLSGTQEPADYFLHPAAFPLMLLPWLVEHQLNDDVDPVFQTDLVFSNANLYYYIRLVDNVMDGHATVEPKLLPFTGYFLDRFHDAYHDYFEFDHAFWDYFRSTWADFCDVTAADGLQTDMDEKTFKSLIGRKVGAAKISLAAVCFRYDRPDLIPAWDKWMDLFGRWHLFQEDLFDWRQDLQLGAVTYFLCEAKRRKRPDEPEISWIAREGLGWGFDQLDGWMKELREMDFPSQEVVSYLESREKDLLERRDKLGSALETIRRLSRRISDE